MNNTNINWHSIRSIALLALVFIIGGLQAMNGSAVGDFTVVISVLAALEHFLQGNSGTV